MHIFVGLFTFSWSSIRIIQIFIFYYNDCNIYIYNIGGCENGWVGQSLASQTLLLLLWTAPINSFCIEQQQTRSSPSLAMAISAKSFFPKPKFVFHFIADQDDGPNNFDEQGHSSGPDSTGSHQDGVDDEMASVKDLAIGSPYSTGTNHSQALSNCSTPAPPIMPNISPSASSASTTRDNSISPNNLGGGGSSNSSAAIETLPKLRLNTILAADPALQPEAKDIKRIRSSTADKYSNQISYDEDGDDDVQMDDMPIRILIGSPNGGGRSTSATGHSHRDDRHDAVAAAAAAVDALPPRMPAFMCTPCGIKFSSLSTLEAHQTYYCSHK